MGAVNARAAAVYLCCHSHQTGLAAGWPRAHAAAQSCPPGPYLCHGQETGGGAVGGYLSPPRGPLCWLHRATDPHRRNFFAQPHSSGHSILSLFLSFSSLHSSPSCQRGWGLWGEHGFLAEASCSESILLHTHAHTLPALPVSRAPEPEQSFYRNAEVTRLSCGGSLPERWGCFVLEDCPPAMPGQGSSGRLCFPKGTALAERAF